MSRFGICKPHLRTRHGSTILLFSKPLNKLGGVGHCFAWHVRVSLIFCFNFKTEELIHSGLCAMWYLRHNSTFPAARIKILLWKIYRLLLYLWLLEITKVRIRFQNYLFEAGKWKLYLYLEDIIKSGQCICLGYINIVRICLCQLFCHSVSCV
jgi:hypothetical protein